MIIKMSLKDSFQTEASISRAFWEQMGKPISRKTVSRRINKEKLVAWIPCCKLLISKKNNKFSLYFTIEHIVWTDEQWIMVHFSDESELTCWI